MKLYELADRLKELDEVTLLELLELNSQDIVDRFLDVIEDNYNRVMRAIIEQ